MPRSSKPFFFVSNTVWAKDGFQLEVKLFKMFICLLPLMCGLWMLDMLVEHEVSMSQSDPGQGG